MKHEGNIRIIVHILPEEEWHHFAKNVTPVSDSYKFNILSLEAFQFGSLCREKVHRSWISEEIYEGDGSLIYSYFDDKPPGFYEITGEFFFEGNTDYFGDFDCVSEIRNYQISEPLSWEVVHGYTGDNDYEYFEHHMYLDYNHTLYGLQDDKTTWEKLYVWCMESFKDIEILGLVCYEMNEPFSAFQYSRWFDDLIKGENSNKPIDSIHIKQSLNKIQQFLIERELLTRKFETEINK